MIYYEKYQNKIQSSRTYGQWYGRTSTMGTVSTDELADRIQQVCTLKKSDVMACISEFFDQMRIMLLDGKAVKIGQIGTFRVGMNSTGAATKDEFSVAKNLKGLKLLFRPYRQREKGVTIYPLLVGGKLELKTKKAKKASQTTDNSNNSDNTENPGA